VLPGHLHGVLFETRAYVKTDTSSTSVALPSADAAARASDLARLASRTTPFTPNVNDATAAFLRRVLRDAFPARPLGRIDVQAIVAALKSEGSAVRDAALWTPAVAAAASAFAPGGVGLGVAERSAGVHRAIRVQLNFSGRVHNKAAASVEEAARTYDLLSIMRGPVMAGNTSGILPNCGPDTAAFFRAAVDLHFGAGRGVGVSWDDARRAVEDATSPVYAAARWTRRAAATAARTAALLSASPAGWLDAFGDIWEGTAGLDDDEEEEEEEEEGDDGDDDVEGGEEDEDGGGKRGERKDGDEDLHASDEDGDDDTDDDDEDDEEDGEGGGGVSSAQAGDLDLDSLPPLAQLRAEVEAAAAALANARAALAAAEERVRSTAGRISKLSEAMSRYQAEMARIADLVTRAYARDPRILA
jgi:hypothetical protein